MKKIILIFLVIVLVIFLFLLIPYLKKQKFSPITKQLINPRLTVTKKNQLEINPQFSAWLPWWETEKNLISLENAQDRLKAILPVWYRLEEDSQIKEISVASRKEISQFATTWGILMIPTIANDFDAQRVSILLVNQQLWERTAHLLVNWAKQENYQGWDLDWEEIKKEDRDRFVAFVAFLREKLHQENLILSVTVHAQTGYPDDWQGALGHDYSGLAKAADQIRIMAYDFHHAKSEPGPITPLDKLDQVLKYALKTIPEEKIVLGLPTYGYDWDKTGGEPLQYTDVLKRLEEFDGVWSRDQESFALTGSYLLAGEKHTLWFEDKQSALKKIKIAQGFRVYQFCFWSLAGEDPGIWEIDLNQ